MAAEINRKDVISDEALAAPLILKKNFDDLIKSIDGTLVTFKDLNSITSSNTKSVKAVSTEVKNASDSNKELLKTQEQLNKVILQQNDNNIKLQRSLAQAKQDLRDKIKLGDQDALTANKQNSSLNQLAAALAKNRQSWANLRTEEERASKQGQELISVINKQDKEVNELSEAMGKTGLKVQGFEGAMKSLKMELKLANDQLAHIADTAGEESEEFKEAAAKAGQLRDKIDDLKQSTKAVSGTPIENFAGSFSLLQDKVRGLDFKGAASAINGIAKSAKDLTFKEATNGVNAFGSAMGGLGKALLTNPIFLITVAIAGAVLAFKYFQAEAEKVTTNTINRAKREMEAITDRYDQEIKLMQIAGEKTYDLERQKQRSLIRTAEVGIKASEDVFKFDLLMSLASMRYQETIDEEKVKRLKEFTELKRKALQELQIINAQEAADNKKSLQDQAKERDRIAKQNLDELKKAIEAEKEEERRKIEYLTKLDLERGSNQVKDYQDRQQAANKVLDNLSKEADLIREQINLQLELEMEVEEGGTTYEERQKKQITLDKQITELRRQRIKDEIKDIQGLESFYSQFSGNLLNLFSNITAGRMQEIDTQEQALKEQADKEIIAAGGNAEAKAIIQANLDKKLADLEKKKRAEQRKYAIVEKGAALVEAAIKTSLAVLNQLSSGDPFTAIPRSILAGAIGAVQIAAIAAKPIPQYAKGTKGSAKGLAIVGELGAELYKTPSGEVGLTPSTATLVSLPENTEITPADETSRLLAVRAISSENLINNENSMLQIEVRLLRQAYKQAAKEIVKAIENSSVDYADQYSILHRVKKLGDGSRLIIRQKSMG